MPVAVLMLLLPAVTWAHPAVATVVLVQVTREDGVARVRANIMHDALAYALNDTSARVTDPQMYNLLKAPEEELAATLLDGRERFAAAFQIVGDGTPIELTLVDSPTIEKINAWKAENPSLRLPCKLEFVMEGVVPAGTSDITIHLPGILGDGLLTVKRPGVEPMYVPMLPGEDSPKIDVRMATAPARPASDTGGDAEADVPHVEPASTRSFGFVQVGVRYVKLGYEHIIPLGWDHALFVLGLFLLSPRFKDVVWQITTFTIAHSVTLTLATLHILTIPSSIVEPTIAATIAFVAIENLFATKVHLWRPLVAFIFGLVHGLGFASALMDVGLPAGQLAVGIIAFNVGVEGGHMTVLLAAFATLGWFRAKKWYRARVSMPLSICIAAVALTWMVQRIM